MKKEIWLFISAFGIMFAVFSWLQESSLILSSDQLGYLKGVYAVITGFVLYIFFRKSL
tara:strand:+ start:243 stop:416 length:174 start_codon:yes stop_codon:yes gene_type:complete